MSANLFKPTAGKMPPILIGRQSIIDDFTDGLVNGAGAPGRLMLITGQRGYGKTVMLTELRRIADAHDWMTISDTASEGLCLRLTEALRPQGLQLGSADLSPSIGVAGLANASLGKASFLAKGAGPLTLRKAIEEQLRSRKIGKGKGILFTIDETQAASRDDLVAIATAVQHVIADQDQKNVPDSEKKGVAFVFAGLPSLVNELVNDRVLTFLRRSLKRELTDVPLPDVKNAYVETIKESHKTISEEIALKAADLTAGYPYMIQLLGYYMWQSAQREGRKKIIQEDVDRGYGDALLAFGDAVCAPALAGVSAAAREFIYAMEKDLPDASRVSDLADRVGKSRSWVNKYREILIEEKLIRPAAHGFVEFAIPNFGNYLLNNRHIR